MRKRLEHHIDGWTARAMRLRENVHDGLRGRGPYPWLSTDMASYLLGKASALDEMARMLRNTLEEL